MSPSNKKLLAGATGVALVASAAGYWIGSSGVGAGRPAEATRGSIVNGVVQDGSGRKVVYWHDPMLPMERYNAPGKSSMGMDLQPKYVDEGAGESGVRVSAEVQQNLGVRTARAVFDNLAPATAAVGRVEVDERRIFEVQTLTPGFLEQLSVRAVGEPVGRGSRVASVYSPELFGAQQEYVALLKIERSTITPGIKRAARQRLALLGLPEGAIRKLDAGGRPERAYPIFAPRSGVVTAIGVRPGARVEPGQSIVTLADLSQIWVVAEVPEATLGRVRIGQPVEISFAAYPQEPRHGRIDYIFPTLDAEARTGRVRVTLSNPAGRLKIGMFANMTIAASATGALVVPSEAVISTGKRDVVIVQRHDAFIPVEVEPGRTVGDKTEIRRGLSPNDVVVVSGQFLIDSEASLAGVIQRLQRSAAPATQQEKPVEGRGVIRAIDAAGLAITLSHEPIATIGWPGMTMRFPVRDASLLRGRKAGQGVRFFFDRPAQGETPVIDRIEHGRAQ